jgi:hypothetical protein
MTREECFMYNTGRIIHCIKLDELQKGHSRFGISCRPSTPLSVRLYARLNKECIRPDIHNLNQLGPRNPQRGDTKWLAKDM